MAYITTEEVQEMRAKIKKQFPTKDGWKFSITRRHYSTIVVDIMKAPIDLTTCSEYSRNGHFNVSQFRIEETYADYPEAMKTFKKIKDIVRGCKEYFDRNAGDVSADYGDSNYFFDLSVGKWNKPFELSK